MFSIYFLAKITLKTYKVYMYFSLDASYHTLIQLQQFEFEMYIDDKGIYKRDMRYVR